MSHLFSEETKRRLEINLLNQIALPSNLEPNAPSNQSPRYFTASEVFTVLYGQTTRWRVNKDELGSQSAGRFVAQEALNPACEVCQTMPPRSCALHRQPTQPLTDRRVSYAVKSLPPECKFGVSYSAGEGCGVYTNQPVPTGTWIGPFEGRRIRPSDVTSEMDTSHMWEIYEGSTLSHYIDGSDENCSSWMRFIRCARHKGEQNLYAFQYNGNIYYRAFKDIPTGTELLVWYDDKYPMYMGIPLGLQVNAMPGGASSGTKASPPEAKKLPPLIPTYTLHQRRPSLESVPRDQRSPLRSDVESDVGNRGNNKIPSPTSQTSELTSWRCQQCHKTFTQRVALQMHVCPTQPTKPYQCGQCSKTFTNSSDLRAHVISHTTERPFKCGFCSRTFVGATTLNNHVRTHMGQKPFSCEKCGKTFSQAMHLARHARESCDLVSEKSRTDTVTTHTLST